MAVGKCRVVGVVDWMDKRFRTCVHGSWRVGNDLPEQEQVQERRQQLGWRERLRVSERSRSLFRRPGGDGPSACVVGKKER